MFLLFVLLMFEFTHFFVVVLLFYFLLHYLQHVLYSTSEMQPNFTYFIVVLFLIFFITSATPVLLNVFHVYKFCVQITEV